MPDATTLIPYLFQPGLRESLTFLTKVMVSNNGYEQKQRLRNAPRQEFSFNIAVPRGEIAKLDTLLYGNRGAEFYLPISGEARLLDQVIPAGITTTIWTDTAHADFRLGSQALLWNSPRDFEVVTIVFIGVDHMVAEVVITKAFTLTSFVMPLRTGVVQGNPKRRTTGDTQRLAGNFRVKENIKLATSPSAFQYKGFDVFFDQPLTLDRYAVDVYSTKVNDINFDTGTSEEFTPWLKTKTQRSFGLQFDSQGDVWVFRLWLHRRAGKLVPFWMPTWENNFKLLSTGALTETLIVQNDGQDTLSTGRNDVALLTVSGWILREILGIIPVGNDLQVTLDSAVGVDASEVKCFSFLTRKRLTSDKMNIVWDGNNTAHATVGITELNDFIAHDPCLSGLGPACTTTADIMVLIDNTGSQSLAEYATVTLVGINDMIEGWRNLSLDLKVGLVLINNNNPTNKPVLREGLTSNLTAIQDSVTAIPDPGGFTNIATAIDVAKNELDEHARGGSIARVIIIITDGAPNAPHGVSAFGDTELSADAAKDSGIRIVIFGVMGIDITGNPGGGGGGG